MWALIREGLVTEIIQTSPAGKFHPSLQWEPCNANVKVGWTYDGQNYAAPVEPDLTVGDFERAIQTHIDAAARAKLYADGTSLATYASSTNAIWAAEAAAFIDWRDAVWLYAYTELAKVQAGTRPVPQSTDVIISELPAPDWPS